MYNTGNEEFTVLMDMCTVISYNGGLLLLSVIHSFYDPIHAHYKI